MTDLDIVLEQMLDLPDTHTVGEVLLVGRHQERDPPDRLVLDHLVKSCLGLLHPLSVPRVHDVDDGVTLLVVLVPQRLELLLPQE